MVNEPGARAKHHQQPPVLQYQGTTQCRLYVLHIYKSVGLRGCRVGGEVQGVTLGRHKMCVRFTIARDVRLTLRASATLGVQPRPAERLAQSRR